MNPRANPSSPYGVIAGTASARAVARTSLPLAFTARDFAFAKRNVTKADSRNNIVRVFCGNCSTPLHVQVGLAPTSSDFASAP